MEYKKGFIAKCSGQWRQCCKEQSFSKNKDKNLQDMFYFSPFTGNSLIEMPILRFVESLENIIFYKSNRYFL